MTSVSDEAGGFGNTFPFFLTHVLFQASTRGVLLLSGASCFIFPVFHSVTQEKRALPSPWIIVNSL